MIIGAVILATPAISSSLGPLGERLGFGSSRPAGIPADAPALGLVYQGLAPAPDDAPCAGTFELVSRETCSHGPDPSPAGLNVARDVKPVAPGVPAPAAPDREKQAAPDDADVVQDEGAATPTSSDTPALVPEAAPADEPFSVGPGGVACAGDGRTGKRIQVLYLYEFGKPSRYTQYLGSFRNWAAGVDAIYSASAAETGGVRRLRYVTTPDCQVDVAEVQVPAGSLGSLESNIIALRKLGYNRTDRKYLIFADAKTYCGISTFIGDRRPGAANRNNAGPSYGRTDAGCWSAAVAAHELTHTLGGVLDDAPNATTFGHCKDGYDLMCYRDAPQTRFRVACTDKNHERRLDCNHDDYFSTNPKPGSFLAKNWNVADSEFLLRDKPDPTPGSNRPVRPTPSAGSAAPAGEPTPADQAEPSAPPPASEPATQSPSAAATTGLGPAPGTKPPASAGTEPLSGALSGAPGIGGGAAAASEPPTPAESSPAGAAPAPPGAPAPQDPAAPEPPALEPILQAGETTSTASRLQWPATGGTATRYAVSVDGKVIGTTRATRARLIGLRPDTEYKVRVLKSGSPYTPEVNIRTAPAAQPAPGSWFLLVNALSGGAADLYAARSAAGTPVVLNRAEGGAQQEWQLMPAGNGSFQMVSKASGKCVVPMRNNPVAGTPLVQGTCAKGETTQYWWVARTDHGFALKASVGDLVVGLGNQRFGDARLLVLQTPDGSRHQSWTALPG